MSNDIVEQSKRSGWFNAEAYRRYLLSLTLASDPDTLKKVEEDLVERYIKREVRRFFEEIQLESVAWVGGYIRISQEELEFQVPFVDPDVGYA